MARLPLFLALAAALLCVVPQSARAERHIPGFKAPAEMTPEELAESKRRSRLAVNDYTKQVTEQVAPIPWLSIGVLSAFLLMAAPYALRFYRDTAGGPGALRAAKPAPKRGDNETRIALIPEPSSRPEPTRPSTKKPPPPPRS